MMRNAAVTTVAPTGTISIIANCSGGIERCSRSLSCATAQGQKQGDKPLVEVNDTFQQIAQERGFYSDELIERIAREGTLAHDDAVPEDIKHIFVCAHDITPDWHMKMQAAFQQHCDASISKTINFPNAATVEDVETIYRLAYDYRCKGVTVYRDGCRSCQPMALKNGEDTETGKRKAKQAESRTPSETPHEDPRLRSGWQRRITDGARHDGASTRRCRRRAGLRAVRVSVCPNGPHAVHRADGPPGDRQRLRIRQMTPFGNMHVKITVDARTERELEIFAQLGKGGDVANGDLEGMCRVGSLLLRSGISIRHLIKQWDGIGTSLQIPTKAGRIMSLPTDSPAP